MQRQMQVRVPDELRDALDRLSDGLPRDRYIRAVLRRHVAYWGSAPEGAFNAREYVALAESGRPSLILPVVLEHLPEAVIVLDPGLIIRIWAGGAEPMFGWTAAEAVGCHLRDRITSAFDVDYVREIRARLGAGFTWRGFGTWHGRAGKAVRGEAILTPIFDDELVGMVATVREVVDTGNTSD
jgi:PAS domain S-box-containing protein